ncbi:MAG: hypothetical protein RL119_1239 [Actinomycetota bacterium]
MGITITRGIRYGRAERFAAPELLPYQSGSELGISGSISPQVPGMFEQLLGTDISQMSEDCLFLDIYAPDDAEPGSLPVLVWIHGGAYVNGAGSLQWYDGSQLASRQAVVVTINYRLGALGFLGEGNWGTLDQICAMQWVQQNIASFGGDASKVTIFGESAGGSAVISLMAAPEARGLFHRVWAMSPSINQLRSLDAAMNWQKEFLSSAGVSSLGQARSLSVDDILAAQVKLLAMESQDYNMFSPTGGGIGLPSDVLGTAAASPLPLSIGTNRDESLLFLAFDQQFAAATTEQWHAVTDRRFGDDALRVRATYEEVRSGASPLQLIAAVQTDHGFRRPAQRLSEARAEQGNPTWMYWFTWASQAFGGILGSAHALDIPFAFDNLHTPGTAMLLGEGPELQELACRFADEIAGFSHKGEASWPTFDTVKRPTLRFDTTVELLHDPEPTLRALHD